MANVKIYFKDLSNEKQGEIIQQLKGELSSEILESIQINNARKNKDKRDVITNEIIVNHINTHNFAQEFKV